MPSTIRKDGYPFSKQIMLWQEAGTDDDSEKIIPLQGASRAEKQVNNVAPDRLHAAWRFGCGNRRGAGACRRLGSLALIRVPDAVQRALARCTADPGP